MWKRCDVEAFLGVECLGSIIVVGVLVVRVVRLGYVIVRLHWCSH
jgi:hypothetical protein